MGVSTVESNAHPELISPGIEMGIATNDAAPTAKADQLPTWRRWLILFIVSWNTLVVTSTSTSLLIATPEISSSLHTTREILNYTNAGVLIAMGWSSLIWSPLAALTSRRFSYNTAMLVMFAASIGTAVAPDLASFTATRLLVGLTGTFFMVSGQTIIADIFKPTIRGRAVGCLQVGSVAGNALGPMLGGIILTFSHWRSMYWLQVAEAGLGLILSVAFIPSIKSEVQQRSEKMGGQNLTAMDVISAFNPWRVIKLYLKPQMFLAVVTCGFLSVSQYGLIASVRPIINPRFHLTTPLIGGLFYIAPGAGFIVGALLGGRFSDDTVKRYISKRGGQRLPKDRLNSSLIHLFIVLPTSLLLFGWSLDKEFGGLALPIVMSFFVGLGLMSAWNGLNTYTGEVFPDQRAEGVASKYVLQYIFGAAATAAVLPMINTIGAGWSFTIFAILKVIGGAFVLFVARFAPDTGAWAYKYDF